MRRLQPQDCIAKYRVISPLGAGGMGEVYLAQDESLGRSVALKVLPAELMQSEERLRRFVLEAKSASSLNHPNIVTIYEIGQDVLRSAGSEDVNDRPLIHFISMELVSGKTLASLIHEEAADLRALLGYLAQAAEGLSKAHAAGIVHRDLKPGNIMVSEDGFTKVLDFGLAKLTEKRTADPAPATAQTVAHEATLEGLIMGTVGYMAPEQVQGKPVDHRADIFALGCILYEAATRRRPFEAESSVEVMHKILHDTPPPVETLNAEVPAELRRLIRRALAKNPDQRIQSMKDLAIELREIVDEFDTLPRSSSSITRHVSVVGGVPSPKRRPRPWVWALIGVIGIAGVVAGIWGTHRHASPPDALPFSRVNSLTNRGDINECVLSKDGRYLAYLTSVSGNSSIHVLQVATGSDVEVTSTTEANFLGLNFSPDGNYLWYLMTKKNNPNYRGLMQVPSLGGEARERAFDVDSKVSFSPDGTQIAFMRGRPQDNQELILVRNLENGSERTIHAVTNPRVTGAVSWSPDGKVVAVLDRGPSAAGLTSKIQLVPLSGGRVDVLSEHRGARLTGLDWMPDSKAVVLSGIDIAISVTSQLQLETVPKGEMKALTNDLSEYEGVSVAQDGSIAATRRLRLGDIWVADVAEGNVKQVLTVTNPDRTPYEVTCVDNQNIHYVGVHEGEIHIFSLSMSGGEPRPLTPAGTMVIHVAGYVGGLLLTQVTRNELIPHIWSMNADGSNLRQLTHGAGENTVDVTRDGRTFLYARVDTSGYWLAGADGSAARLVGGDAKYRFGGLLSPDGQFVEVFELARQGDMTAPIIHIFKVSDDTEFLTYPALPTVRSPAWANDSKAYYFLDSNNPEWNVVRASHGNQSVVPVTQFKEGRLQSFAFAPDDRHIAVTLRIDNDENVWVTGPNGEDAKQITQFSSKRVFRLAWTPDSSKLVIYAGQDGRDAVVLKRT